MWYDAFRAPTLVHMEYIGICANERLDPTPEADGYAAHSHDSYEIFLPVAGSLAFDVEAYRYTVERGSVLILPPFVSHRLIVQDSEPLEYLYAQFSPKAMPDEEDLKETVESLFHGYGEGEMSMRHLPKESFAFVYGAIKRLCVSGTKEVHHQFFRILSPLLREILLYGIPVNGKQGELAKKGSRKTALTDQIVDYVSLHYADIQDLSFVVDVFHYSTVHVNSHHIGKAEKYPPMLFIWSDDDIPCRPEQLTLTVATIKSFGYDMSEVETVVRHGKHVHYALPKGDADEFELSEIIRPFIEKHTI